MKITSKDKYTILADDRGSVADFATHLEFIVPKHYDQYNLIIDLLKYEDLSLEQLIAFLKLSNYQRADKKSFVIVNKNINYDFIPDEMVVVPTIQEAIDVIEMEEIERDLGL
ncbi:ribonuclease Z [Dokdonia sp. Hel_I_53]|uniref:ribonuclease Z n=1 Tax=Dokdonia sp. Hel_I_53 TaxID=1566287 RepID=UPI00119BBD78|nr:ribonuclease Z [Dokdonia sp. Hel_I_53]TVZ51148.1 hypothetical protein OD90_0284 [Dokdonia sp. Hel_I_53]